MFDISCKEYFEKVKSSLKNKDLNDIVFHVFQVNKDEASNAYVNGKIKDCAEVGIRTELHNLKMPLNQDDLEQELENCVYDSGNVKIMLQLPVPKSINAMEVLNNVVYPWQDVDGFLHNSDYEPATAKGVVDWLEYNDYNLSGKSVVIIGRSDIVGKPLAKLMTNKDATVVLCHSKTKNIEDFCKLADLIVVAVGKPKFFKMDLPNAPAIIDVGINVVDGKLVGDVDKEYMESQGCYVSPVPGGVGLLTRAALLQNVAKTTR